MKIVLLHNPQAGRGEPPADALKKAFREDRHQVVYRSTKSDRFADALDQPADVVAVAGGDGTFRKVFRQMAERPRVPMLLLSLGTANNLARSLGCDGPWEESIADLPDLVPRPFQFGRMTCGGSEDWFFEGVGAGLFAAFLHLAEDDPRFVDLLAGGREGFERDHAGLARLAAEMPSMEITLGSEHGELRDNFLWVEVMNIPSIGPHLALAPAECMDGKSSMRIALVPEVNREALVSYFETRMNDGEATFPGIHWKCGAEVRISWPGGGYHVDDETRETSAGDAMIRASRMDVPLIVLKH